MSVKIEIETSNAAFETEPELEVARILRNLAWNLEGFGWPEEGEDPMVMTLRDTNGNKVGTCTCTPEDCS